MTSGSSDTSFYSLLRRYSLNAVLILLSLAMTGAVILGVMSRAKPGEMTWGPTVDIDAASIALSEMYSARMNGIGRTQTANAIARHVTSTGDFLQIGGDPTLVADPKNVEAGFKEGAFVYTPALAAPKPGIRSEISTFAEDIGYTDFYYFAFRLFGVHSLSTHYLFLSVLTATVLLFSFGMWRSRPALSLLAIATSAFFLMTTAGIFMPTLPNIAANRFLSTLIIIPLLHIALFAISRENARLSQWLLLAVQILLFAFIVTLRSSANWATLALTAIALFTLIGRLAARTLSTSRQTLQLPTTRMNLLRVATVIIVPVTLAAAWQGIRDMQLHPIYRSGEVLPNHLRWHSAFLGLANHPEWSKNLPIPELANVYGDDIGWTMYMHQVKLDLPAVDPISTFTASYKFGLVEKELQKATLDFITLHPKYAFELYGYYKPTKAAQIVSNALANIPLTAWLLGLPTLIAASIGLAGARFNRLETGAAILFIWIASFAPVIWAWPEVNVISDGIYATILFSIFLLSCGGAVAINTFAQRREDGDHAPKTGPAVI